MPSPAHILQQIGGVALLSLVIAVVPAIAGVAYALWPTEAKLALIRPLSLASLFAALAGCVAGIINGIMWVTMHNEPFSWSSAMLTGFAESLVPLFVSFSSLTVTWLLVALGLRRQAA
jgi:hypothetical protein